ncbi:hypothetical protein BGZ82_001904 [Podila clonocystis]|nr:hypothetical protein BGZ82_001904 [Podila clonocystis]
MMREKLYIDMLNSVGILIQQGAWSMRSRSCSSSRPVHGGNGKFEHGSSVKTNSWNEIKSTPEYKGDKISDYNTQTYCIYENFGNNPIENPLEDLVDLMRDLNPFNPISTPSSTQNTLGAPLTTTGSLPQTTMYKNLVRKLIIENKEMNGLFGQILKELVSTSFKTQAIKPGIEMYNQIMSVDAKWDSSLTRRSPGINNNFSFEYFNNNLHTRTRDMTSSLFGCV